MLSTKASKALRKFCLECQGGSSVSVASCADTACTLYPFRSCTTDPACSEERPLLRAIRAYCFACAASRQDIRLCDAKDTCALWSYRFGVLPTTFKRVVARNKKKRETLFLPGLPEEATRK